MSKKEMLSSLFYATGLVPVVASIRDLLVKEVHILAYHRILDVDAESQYPFDPELISANREDFRWQIQYLKKHYTPITFSYLIDKLKSGQALPPKPVIVTFDDGFEDNYTHAFPILKEQNVPATIFLATEYIGKKKTFWFDWLVYLLKSDDELAKINIPGLYLDATRGSSHAIKQVLSYLKRIPNESRIEVIDQIERQVGKTNPEDGFIESRPLNWNQVKEMSDWGIEFGSHSVSHPVLANVKDDDLWQEIKQSKITIEEKIGKTCQVIAYPVGGKEAYDDRVIAMVIKADYELGVSYIVGSNRLANLDRYGLRRLHVETDVSRKRFAASLSLPSLSLPSLSLPMINYLDK